MKQFCFNVRNANSGAKLVCGTITADDMQSAAINIAKRLHLVIEINPRSFSTHYTLWLKTHPVNLHITAIPEFVLLGRIPDFTTPSSVVDETFEEVDL